MSDRPEPSGDEPSVPTAHEAPRAAERQEVRAAMVRRADEDNYELGGEIARGGAGRVVQAVDRRLQRTVAVKELRHDHPTLRARFQREVHITASLAHPNIVPVYEAGEWENGTPFYAMKFVEGESLARAVERCADFESRALLIPHVIDAADAIAYAHSRDVIHRDLKPLNVLVGPFGETLVIDWGLAKDLNEDAAPETAIAPPEARGITRREMAIITRETEAASLDANETEPESPESRNNADNPDNKEPIKAPSGTFATTAGAVIGTPAYMPPEQARGEAVDERADVYALGAILYHVLAGTRPYTGLRKNALMRAVLDGPPLPLATVAPEASRDLIAVVEKAMARDADLRYPTAEEMAAELRRYAAGRRVYARDYTAWERVRRYVRQRSRFFATIAVAACLLLATVVWAFVSVSREATRARAAADAEQIARKTAEKNAAESRDNKKLSDAAAKRANADRQTAERRADELVLERARLTLSSDPTMSVAWLKELKEQDGELRGVATIAAEAVERGVAKRILTGHRDLIRDLVVDPSHRFAATAGADGVLHLHSLDGGETRRLTGHEDDVAALAFDPTGRRLASVGYDGNVLVWTVPDDEPRKLSGHFGAVLDVEFSPDGSQLATIGDDTSVRLWDLETGVGRELERSRARDARLGFHPSGRWLVTGSHGNTLHLHDLERGRATVLRGPTSRVTSLAFAPLRHSVLAGCLDGSVWIWSLDTGTGLQVVPRNTAAIGTGAQVAWSPVGDRIAVTDGATAVELMAAPGTSPSDDRDGFRYNGKTRITTLAFSPDGNTLLWGGWDHKVHAYSLNDGHTRQLAGHDDVISKLALTDALILSASWDKTIRVWPLERSKRRLTTVSEGGAIALAVSRDGHHLATAGHDAEVKLQSRNASTWSAPVTVATLGDPVVDLAFTGKGERLLIATETGNLAVHTLGGETQAFAASHEGEIRSIELSLHARRFLTTSHEGSVAIWDLDEVDVAARLRAESAINDALFINADVVLTGERDGSIRAWTPSDGTQLRRWGKHEDAVRDLAMSPDGGWIAAVGGHSISFWKSSTGESHVVPTGADSARLVEWVHDSSAAVVAGPAGGLRLCAPETGACRHIHTDEGVIMDIATSTSSQLALTAGASNTVRVWDLESTESVPLLGHEATVLAVAFDPSGNGVFSVSSDGRLGTWVIPTLPKVGHLRARLDELTDERVPSATPDEPHRH